MMGLTISENSECRMIVRVMGIIILAAHTLSFILNMGMIFFMYSYNKGFSSSYTLGAAGSLTVLHSVLSMLPRTACAVLMIVASYSGRNIFKVLGIGWIVSALQAPLMFLTAEADRLGNFPEIANISFIFAVLSILACLTGIAVGVIYILCGRGTITRRSVLKASTIAGVIVYWFFGLPFRTVIFGMLCVMYYAAVILCACSSKHELPTVISMPTMDFERFLQMKAPDNGGGDLTGQIAETQRQQAQKADHGL